MVSVKYVRRRRTAETFRRVSSRVASRRPTATKTSRRPEVSKHSKPNIQKKTTSKADTSISNPETARVPKSQGSETRISYLYLYLLQLPLDATAHHGVDYLNSDELIGWRYCSSTKDVEILTRRPDDGSKRLVPERLIQQKCPSQLYAYWKSFPQPREEIIQTNQYHVFDIIDENSSRGLKVQWVGYSPSDSDTTWEPASKIRKIAPELFDNYVIRKKVSKGHSHIRRSVETLKSDITQ
ncbi:Putative chromo/chromo shadow domain, Chromo-like domain superfamily protein [Colletotrichum destructivum]|uniref:Chromo/chromo shadow domain, Chromo-like domain superfamily protein n=1 Tax=Colletotrichum destructivum TaxID=34406 RepID=A0AAX4J4S4_9PEZI|nr:Putative chromo/chromo shadow domain, Chromo-like domain superfamily protein [Colletotrichum destructivum]